MRAPLLLALLLAGCLAPYGGGDVGSGIFGVATLGPTCPVEREPPDPQCTDRPYGGQLVAESADGGVTGTFSTNAVGEFNVSLPAGEYSIRTPEPGRLPTCSNAEPVVVLIGRWTRADVACDTGIR
jgi:hypothetical protein